jgi:hypothetical protein
MSFLSDGEYCHGVARGTRMYSHGQETLTKRIIPTIVLGYGFPCSYVQASWSFYVWKQNAVTGRLFLPFVPYFHFLNLWGSYVGYTAMPNRTFTTQQLFLGQEELALTALSQPPGPIPVTTMAPQGSTLVIRDN